MAAAKGPAVPVFAHPGDARPGQTLSNPNPDGARLVFLVDRRRGGWLKVYLPVRPNLSTGWIKASAVTLATDPYRLRVDLSQHRLSVERYGKLIWSPEIGVGRAVTPTPSGLYYITELLSQPDPSSFYGPYAFGLSAHSDVLHEFAGRNGEIGIHGTNLPAGIGTDVSHGCIRLSNEDITRLAHTLPLGTPVRIVR